MGAQILAGRPTGEIRMKLKNKVALITGSTSGFGTEIARLFAANGARVIIHGSERSRAAGDAFLAELLADGYDASYFVAELTRPDEIEKMFSKIREQYGRLDILVNNAGRSDKVKFPDVTMDALEKDLQTNFNSAVLCSKLAVEIMDGPGWIINTSSIRGIDYAGNPESIGYCGAKAAINSFTKNLALMLAPRGIYVNAVAPGFVENQRYLEEQRNNPEKAKKRIAAVPIGRIIPATEIAEVYLLLATSKILCGTIIPVDGGYTILNR